MREKKPSNDDASSWIGLILLFVILIYTLFNVGFCVGKGPTGSVFSPTLEYIRLLR